MKKIYKKLILVISLLGLMVLAASCSSSKSASKDNSVKKIQDKGTLVVGGLRQTLHLSNFQSLKMVRSRLSVMI
nr:hypothetical protein [Liquorilactobacillus satsumensis]